MFSKARNTKTKIFLAVLFASTAMFASALTPTAWALAKTYQTSDRTIKTGMVVAVTARQDASGGAKGQIVKADLSNANLAVGIVSNASTSDLTYESNQNKHDSVVVTDTGQLMAYVSDVNGRPQAGDLLAPSPLKGILMRATDGTKGIVASMLETYPTKKAENYKLMGGRTAKIVAVPVNLDIHAADKPEPSGSLQGFANRLTGHAITEAQLFATFAIVMLTLLISGSIVYGAVSNYLIAIGRNPLAGRQLRRGLIEVLGLSLAALAGGAITCWVILWL